MSKQRNYPRNVEYYDEDSQKHDGYATERNGNLTWVEDENGRGDWLAPHEVEG